MVRVGVFERRCADGMSVCKLTFGAEPKDCEVYAVWLAHWNGLAFSPLVEMERYPRRAARNPKRMQRTVDRELQRQGLGTKAQEALKLQHELGKQKRQAAVRMRTAQEKERRFYLHQQKKKEKHRGR